MMKQKDSYAKQKSPASSPCVPLSSGARKAPTWLTTFFLTRVPCAEKQHKVDGLVQLGDHEHRLPLLLPGAQEAPPLVMTCVWPEYHVRNGNARPMDQSDLGATNAGVFSSFAVCRKLCPRSPDGRGPSIMCGTLTRDRHTRPGGSQEHQHLLLFPGAQEALSSLTI